jgi:hypothetical protein
VETFARSQGQPSRVGESAHVVADGAGADRAAVAVDQDAAKVLCCQRELPDVGVADDGVGT